MNDHNTGHQGQRDGHSGHSDDGDGNEPAHGISHGGAGHEMDIPPTKELFNIVWGLGALTLLSLVTCVQLFNNQQRDIMTERGNESSQVLAEYRKGMESATRTAGESTFKDSSGAEIKQRHVPLTVARELVLSKPERMQAAAPPKGWMHPDDIAAGVQAGAPAGAAGSAVQAPPDAGSAPGAGPAAIVPGNAAPGGQPAPSGNPGTPEAPTGTLNPDQPGPIAPSRPGTDAPDAVHSEPGVPVADPKVTGKTGSGAGSNVPGTVDGKPTGGAVAPATGSGTAGKAPATSPATSPTPAPAH